MVYQHRLGIADEGDVVHCLEGCNGPVEHEKLEGLGVTYPQEVCLRIVVQVAHFLYAGRYGAKGLFPQPGSVDVVCPEVCAVLGSDIDDVVFVICDSFKSGVAHIRCFRHLDYLGDGIVIGSGSLAHPVGLAAEIQVVGYGVYGYAFQVCLSGCGGSHLHGYRHVEADLINCPSVSYGPHKVSVLAEAQAGKLRHLGRREVRLGI